jgi:hypothetical protein
VRARSACGAHLHAQKTDLQTNVADPVTIWGAAEYSAVPATAATTPQRPGLCDTSCIGLIFYVYPLLPLAGRLASQSKRVPEPTPSRPPTRTYTEIKDR